MTTLQEALPCPFCGKQHTLQVISGQELMDENQEFWQHSESFGVVCDASTPDGKGGCGAKVQVEYYVLRKESPRINFLEATTCLDRLGSAE